jgi:magnesium transporter
MPDPARTAFLYLSSLLGRRIRNSDGSAGPGTLFDVAARLEDAYPRLTRVFVRRRTLRGSRYLSAPWQAVREFSPDSLLVEGKALEPVDEPTPAVGEILLREDVLDQQVVDVGGAKVVRVNDVHLLRTNGDVRLAHVDIGTRGLARRLGIEGPFTGLIRWLFAYEIPEKLVRWKNVHLILEPEEWPQRATKISLAGRLPELHPADLADIMEELDPRSREMVFQSLPLTAAAEALEETQMDVGKGLIEAVADERAADILEQMSSPAAADLLGDLSKPHAEEILDEMDRKKAALVRQLLVHHDETAGGLMTTAIIRLGKERTVGEALDRVRTEAATADLIYYLYAVDDEGKLWGVVNLKELYRAPLDAPLEPLLTRNMISVPPETGTEEVVRLFTKYGFRAIPVVDAREVLLGAIRFRAMVAAVAPELSG